jgi:hypothetical protein
MPYTHDVFISYKRGTINEEWLDKTFLPLFKGYLNLIAVNEVDVYLDREGIVPGTSWPDSLRRNLAGSKCMVAIMSPSYFMKRSEWCVREFISMKYRQEVLQLHDGAVPPCLVWPVMLQSIPLARRPTLIHDIQLKDYSSFQYFEGASPEDPDYKRFKQTLNADCQVIAEIIDHAPEWQLQWESQDWLDMIERQVQDHFTNYNPVQGL